MSYISSVNLAGGGGASPIDILHTQDGTNVAPVLGRVNISGDGDNISTTGVGNTVMVNMTPTPTFTSVTINTAPVPVANGMLTIQATQNTVGAVTNVIFNLPVAMNQSVLIKGYIIGTRSTFATGFGAEFLVMAQRQAGNAIILPGPINNITTNSTSNITFTITNPGTLNVNVVGVAAQNWTWVGTFSYMYL